MIPIETLLEKILEYYDVVITEENKKLLRQHIENLFSDPWQK